MLDRILVPLDGSELAEQILTPLAKFLRREDANLLLVRVVSEASATEQAQAELAAVAARLENDGLTVAGSVRVGDPAEQILDAVDELKPDMVAIATHGRSGISRWIRGSVAERVLRGCSVPVLVANPRAATETGPAYPHVLVPLDGSRRSATILPLVEAFAKLHQAEVTLLRVGCHPWAPASADTIPIVPSKESLLASLEPARAQLEAAGLLRVRTRVEMGDEAESILEAAEGGKSLIAMTTHGRSGTDRWLFGSVAEKVLRHCRCPVLVKRVVSAPSLASVEADAAATADR